jgi:hypothetical protein
MDLGTVALSGFGRIIFRDNVFKDISPHFRANMFLTDNVCGALYNNTIIFDNNIVSTA